MSRIKWQDEVLSAVGGDYRPQYTIQHDAGALSKARLSLDNPIQQEGTPVSAWNLNTMCQEYTDDNFLTLRAASGENFAPGDCGYICGPMFAKNPAQYPMDMIGITYGAARMIKLSDTQFLYVLGVYDSPSYKLKACVGTLQGQSITFGTTSTLETAPYAYSQYYRGLMGVALTSTKVLLTWDYGQNESSTIKMLALVNISGGVASSGYVSSFDTQPSYSCVSGSTLCAIDATRALLITNKNSTTTLSAWVLTVSGTTSVVFGTPITNLSPLTPTSSNYNGCNIKAIKMTSSNFVVISYGDTGGGIPTYKASCYSGLSISGTTITIKYTSNGINNTKLYGGAALDATRFGVFNVSSSPYNMQFHSFDGNSITNNVLPASVYDARPSGIMPEFEILPNNRFAIMYSVNTGTGSGQYCTVLGSYGAGISFGKINVTNSTFGSFIICGENIVYIGRGDDGPDTPYPYSPTAIQYYGDSTGSPIWGGVVRDIASDGMSLLVATNGKVTASNYNLIPGATYYRQLNGSIGTSKPYTSSTKNHCVGRAVTSTDLMLQIGLV